MPSEETIQSLIDTITSPFGFVDVIKDSVKGLIDIVNEVVPAPSFSIDIPETKYTSKSSFDIDFSWYSPYKKYVDIIITVFVYISFIWRVFVNLPNIISGISNISTGE